MFEKTLHVQPVMNTMVDLMGLYHNYSNIVELLLEIYCEAAKRMLCYLPTSQSRLLYQQTINLIQVYAHHNQVNNEIKNLLHIMSHREKDFYMQNKTGKTFSPSYRTSLLE